MAVAAGLVFMTMGGAPIHFILVNAATLLLVAVLIWIVPSIPTGNVRPILTLIIAGLIAATLVSGIAIDDVRRWLPLGPLRLHAGMLLLPAFMVVIQRIDQRFAFAATVAVALTISVQPDLASALALSLSAVIVALSHRSNWSFAAAVISIAVLLVSIFNMVQLPPVAFVEMVIPSASSIHPVLAIALIVSLFSAIIWPIRLLQISDQTRRTERLAFVASIAGFAIASLTGSYPVPFLGYGASPIIGYGLGVALFRTATVSQSKNNVK